MKQPTDPSPETPTDQARASIRFTVDHGAALDYQRRQLFGRLPLEARLVEPRGAPEPAELEAYEEDPALVSAPALVRRRALQNPARYPAGSSAMSALRALAALPGLARLDGPEQVALLALIEGPDLGAGHPRATAIDECWSGRRLKLATIFTTIRSKRDPDAQAKLLREVLSTPREVATLIVAKKVQHGVLALGWKPGVARALVSYGQLPSGLGRGQRWRFVESPDRLFARSWEGARSAAEVVYETTTYRVSIEDERHLVEWIERGFAVNQEREEHARRRGDPSHRSFADEVEAMLGLVGRRRADGGVAERGQLRGGRPFDAGRTG